MESGEAERQAAKLFILLFILLSCVPAVASGKAERSGAEKEAKKLVSYFLWRRERSKETSTLTKASPYMERMQLKIADTDDLSGFWYGSQAFALKGEPWSIIGWRMEKSTETLIIYTIVKTPGCGAEPHSMALERAGRGVRGTSGGKAGHAMIFLNRLAHGEEDV